MAYAPFWRRVTASLMISTTLAACSADGLMPPAGVDGGTRVGAIRPPAAMPSGNGPLPGAMPPVSVDRAQAYGYGRAATTNADVGTQQQPMPALPADAQWGGPMPSTLSSPSADQLPQTAETGVNMDAELGVAGNSGVVGLAQEQENEIAEGVGSQPVVDGIGTDTPVALGNGRARAGVQPMADEPVIVPPKRGGSGQRSELASDLPGTEQPWQRQSTPFGTRQVSGDARTQEVAMLRTPNPMEERAPIAPRGPEAMPASEAACRVELRRIGVEYRNLAPINDGPSCGIPYPIELSGLSGDIDVKPAVKLNCQTTLAFARWVKYELAPSSRYRYWSGVKRIVPMGGYSCRRMNNSRQKYNPMSEHARGNAIDVGKFVLKNGHDIDVRKKGLFSFREGALLKAVRTDSCKYFNTVLGPGSNKEHWNHFHFDLRQRKSSSRYCD